MNAFEGKGEFIADCFLLYDIPSYFPLPTTSVVSAAWCCYVLAPGHKLGYMSPVT